MKRLALLLFLLSAVQVNAATYTIGADASDDYTTHTLMNVGEAVAAGDIISFRKGETFGETVTVEASGSAGSPITYTAHGTGADPIITGRGDISGWDTGGNWTDAGSNVWYFTLADFPYRIWLSDVEYLKGEALGDIDSTSRWYHDDTNDILYVYATESPHTMYTDIDEAISLQIVIEMGTKDYITIQNLDVRGGEYSILIQGCDYIIIEDCSIGTDAGIFGIYVSKSGANVSQNGTIRNNTINTGYTLTCGYYPISWAYEGITLRDGTSYWDVYGNTITNWHHGGFNIKNNNQASYPTQYNEFYNNTITAPDVSYGRAFATLADNDDACQYNEIYKNLIYDTTVQSHVGGNNNSVYYNIFHSMTNTITSGVGSAYAISFRQGYTGNAACSYNKVYNNVIYNTEMAGINLTSTQDVEDVVINNEITNNIILNCGSQNSNYGIVLSANAIESNIFKNNCIYVSGTVDLIDDRGTPRTVAEFNATTGDTTSGNIAQDPQFVDAANDDFRLRGGSPCKNAGTDVGLSRDYADRNLSGIPDIGAYELPSGRRDRYVGGYGTAYRARYK